MWAHFNRDQSCLRHDSQCWLGHSNCECPSHDWAGYIANVNAFFTIVTKIMLTESTCPGSVTCLWPLTWHDRVKLWICSFANRRIRSSDKHQKFCINFNIYRLIWYSFPSIVSTAAYIIDSAESNKELTNPTYIGDSLALHDHDDDSTTSQTELVDTHNTSVTSTSDHGNGDDVDVYNSSTDIAGKLQTHISLIKPNCFSFI